MKDQEGTKSKGTHIWFVTLTTQYISDKSKNPGRSEKASPTWQQVRVAVT